MKLVKNLVNVQKLEIPIKRYKNSLNHVFIDLPFETYTDENGIKTIIECKTNDDGKKVKVCCFL